MTSLSLMTRGYLGCALNTTSLQTRGWLCPVEDQPPVTPSSGPRPSSGGGARWIPPYRIPQQNLPGISLDDLGLRISVQAGAEISKSDIYDMIALSIAEELHSLKKNES